MIVTLDDGATTTVERWGVSGPALLCVHGMSGSRRSWLRLAAHVSGRFQVVAYDQRGHGDSAGIIGPMALDRGVDDAVNVARAIGGIDFLVGHSWGGAVAIRAGERIDVRGIVAIDPMIAQVSDAWYAEYIQELDAAFVSTGAAREAETRADHADWHPLDIDGKVHAFASMTSRPIAGLRDENPTAAWDLREDIARYSKPLLLAMAARDESIVPDDVMAEVTAHHSRNVSIETFEGAGHSLHRTHFDSFAAALEEYLCPLM